MVTIEYKNVRRHWNGDDAGALLCHGTSSVESFFLDTTSRELPRPVAAEWS
jgi:hypothetical protein